MVSPALGTPASGFLTNCSGLPAASISQGTMASGMVLVAPALGTPASGVLTNCSGTAASLTAGKATVTDSTANTAFPVVFNDESNALLDDTGAFTYNPSSGALAAGSLTLSTDLTVAHGGTGASTASAARDNLGLQPVIVYHAAASSDTSGEVSISLGDTLGSDKGIMVFVNGVAKMRASSAAQLSAGDSEKFFAEEGDTSVTLGSDLISIQSDSVIIWFLAK